MRTRDDKRCGPGEYYHIYNRGNAKEDIFRDEADYKFFLLRLKQSVKPDGREGRSFKPLPAGSFSIIAYCLMPNHFHLLVRQNLDLPTSKLLGKVCTSYSMYSNRKYSRVGHIFQDQFKQKNIGDNGYLLGLSVYIHLNPVEAGIVKKAEEYPWSSVHDFIGNSGQDIVEPGIILSQFSPGGYLSFLEGAMSGKEDCVVPKDLLFD